jgi:hypothetical protein
VSENQRAMDLWLEFKGRNPYPSDLLPILQKGDSDVRTAAWDHFKSLNPSRRFVIDVIVSTSDFKHEAWMFFRSLYGAPELSELLQIIEGAESLHEAAWSDLLGCASSEEDLIRVIKAAPSLMERAFARLLLFRPFEGQLSQLRADVPATKDLVDAFFARPKGTILTDLLAVL